MDVLVIGGGQRARPGMGTTWHSAGLYFQLVEARAEIGHVWRSRWDSLRLVHPAQYGKPAGLPVHSSPTLPG